MNSMRAVYCSSVQVEHMPVGGIALRPFFTDSTNAGIPLAIRGSQAA